MVCQRCIMAVRDILERENITIEDIRLGEVRTREELDTEQLNHLDHQLRKIGFELIDDRKKRIIEKIKTTIVGMVHYSEENQKQNLSAVLAEQLHYDYNYLSSLFSEIEGMTIEKFLIAQKIERVKELLVYDELSLSEIADRLGYSSGAHLSNQFKKVTGLSPSHFRTIRDKKRKPLDQL